MDFSQAPIVVDIELLRRLRCQLHSVKKTFSGKEFVDNLLSLTRQEDTSESPANEVILHHQSISYSNEYGIELGQYLLDNGLLSMAVTHHLIHATPNPSEVEASVEGAHDERKIFTLTSSYRFTEAEDKQVNIRKHQVFQAVRENSKQTEQSLEERGRLGTLLLISDILVQRSHQERRLKDFTKSNKFQEVTREVTSSTCLCIVHL